MNKPWIGSVLVVAATMTAVAGCGGSSSGGSSSAPEAAAKSAAAAFITALKAKDAAGVCQHIQFPANTGGTCVQGVGQLFAAGGLTGTPVVGDAVVSGNRALVATTGKFCLAKTCISNTDPKADLPSGSTTFSQAYASVQHSAKSPDLNLVKSGSNWLVVLGS